MCIAPGQKQTTQNCNLNASLALFISSIDSAVKLQAKSDFYVSRYVSECILAWLREKSRTEKEPQGNRSLVKTLPVILIILSLCEDIQQGFLLCAWKSGIEVRLS